MTKFLIILLIIIVSAFFGLRFLKKRIMKKIDEAIGVNMRNFSQEQERKSTDEIVYEKEDIIVLKGESKNKGKK